MGRDGRGRWTVGDRDAEPDPVAVDHCIAGQIPAPALTTVDRRIVVATLAGRGMSDQKIAERTGWGTGTRGRGAVCAFRRRHHIPAGVRSPAADRVDRRAGWWRDPATREQQVRQLAGVGASDWEIGRCAGVAAKTVWAYRHSRQIPAGRPRRGSTR